MFGVPVSAALTGRTHEQSEVGESTGCTVVAIATGGGFQATSDARSPLPDGADLVLVGDSEAEHRALTRFPGHPQ